LDYLLAMASPVPTISSSDPSNPLVEEQQNSASTTNSQLSDEYNRIDLSGMQLWTAKQLVLESGETLYNPTVAYKTFGQLNAERNNVLLVCHALTGHAALDDWWGGLLGPGKPFDTSKYFIICANILGSCYGTCGPLEINPLTQRRYAINFPYVTVRDTVALHYLLLTEKLQITRIEAVIGGSLGGFQALEWAFFGPKYVKLVVALACNAKQTAWQIGLNAVQRNAIFSDRSWQDGHYMLENPPSVGLGIARQLAMITYRTHTVYAQKFDRNTAESASNSSTNSTIWNDDDVFKSSATSGGSSRKKSNSGRPQHLLSPPSALIPSQTTAESLELSHSNGLPHNSIGFSASAPHYAVESYLSYQGKKFDLRFDAVSYVRISEQLDSHDVGRGRGGVEKALKSLQQPVLVMGIDSDALYPLEEQKFLAQNIQNVKFVQIHSIEGHDGFLLEQQQISAAIQEFLIKHQDNS
jgi:homoserine O-acetyltransferase